MKVCVMNFSGNVGKTTIAGHLLQPRMNNAPIFSVESLNADGSSDGLEVEKVKGKRFGELVEQIMMLDEAIIDVGASNVEDFVKLMQQYDSSHEEFDYFLIPTIKTKKQQADTVNTISALAAIGVPRKKIRIIFNLVEVDDSIEHDFASIFGLFTLEKSFIVNQDAVVYNNEVFEKLKSVNKSLAEINADETDYRKKMREPGIPQEEKEFCVRMVSLKRLGATAKENLDNAFEAVFRK